MSTKSYRPWAPDQSFLLPPSPRDWLPEDHLALFLLRVIEHLDLSPIHAAYAAKDPRGERPYAPEMLTLLLLYAYCTGTFSSRKIEKATYEDVAFRVLAGGSHPDHATIARFRKNFFEILGGLFVQVVRLCKELGLVDLSRVALDGSSVQANASKHKAMSYARMKKKRERLKQEIERLLERANAVDAEEDELYGEDHNGLLHQLPEELSRREDQLKAIEEALEALESGARESRAEDLEELAAGNDERAEDADLPESQRKAAATRARKQRRQAEDLRQPDQDEDDEPPSSEDPTLPLEADAGEDAMEPDASSDEAPEQDAPDSEDSSDELPSRRVKPTADGTPHAKAQRNFTDPDSSIMEHQGGFIQAYNTQIVVTEEQIIVGQGASNTAPDTYHLPPLVGRVAGATGELPTVLLADAGYWAPDNAAYCEEAGIDAYIATGRENKAVASESTGVDPPPAPRDEMRAKVLSEHGKRQYRDRKWMVEPVFGQIKEAMGFRRFSTRGLGSVRAEWALVCACHNLLKLWRRNALPA